MTHARLAPQHIEQSERRCDRDKEVADHDPAHGCAERSASVDRRVDDRAAAWAGAYYGPDLPIAWLDPVWEHL